VVKVQGEFVWHQHEDTDETFIVLKGELEIAFRDGFVVLQPGEMFVVPGTNTCALLASARSGREPRGVVNTGDAGLRSPLE
jgi:mannose-6-phosphate isomerase-like protein (cupin superfamily)